MRPTFHLLPAATWAAFADDMTRPYTAASLATDGFIHCTDGEDELITTAERYYRDDPRPYLALTIDLDAAGSRWTIEDPGRIYPHVHGPIAREAIVAVRVVRRDADGAFSGLEEP